MNAFTPTHADLAAPVRQFVQEHRDGLWQAARLLGGYEAAREVERLVEALASEMTLSRRTCQRLQALLDLLSLKNVHDSDRVEWGAFAVIDPCDPCVAQICLLADQLRDALRTWQRNLRRAGRGTAAPDSTPPTR